MDYWSLEYEEGITVETLKKLAAELSRQAINTLAEFPDKRNR